MKIGFVGKGKVASAFSKYLLNYGCTITGFHTRSKPAPEVLTDCDIIFAATPDDSIAAALKGIKTNAKILCHFSGALPSYILKEETDDKITVASLHPAMTFTENTDLSSIIYAFEGSGDSINEFKSFLQSIDIKFFEIKTEQKPGYHAAMCNISNHITTLVDMTEKMLQNIGIDYDSAKAAITPLAKAALENALTHKPGEVLTGPISRGDVNTVRLHMPYADDAFCEMAKKTAELAFESNRINKEVKDEIIKVIDERGL